MRKFVIEVTERGIKKTFIDDDVKYSEFNELESENNEISLTNSLEEEGYNKMLISLIKENKFDELSSYLSSNKNSLNKGYFIRNLAKCSNCNTALLDKYENGIDGISILKKDKKGYYTNCPVCNSGQRHFVDFK